MNIGRLLLDGVKQNAIDQLDNRGARLILEQIACVIFTQAMLGHADLRTTQIYTQVSIRKLQQIHKLTHPADLPPTTPELETPASDSTKENFNDSKANESQGATSPQLPSDDENPSDSDPK